MIEHRRFILDEKVKMDELKLVGLEPGNIYLRMKMYRERNGLGSQYWLHGVIAVDACYFVKHVVEDE